MEKKAGGKGNVNTDDTLEYIEETGFIVKGIGGFYYVAWRDAQGNERTVECRARGKFRQDGVTPLPGDKVRIQVAKGKNTGGYVTEVLPRRNVLARPPVANVDQLVLVLSAAQPAPDFLLADKLLVQADVQEIAPLIVLNKMDIAEEETKRAVRRDYGHLPLCFLEISALSGEGVQALREALRGKLSCFAGQSAVGKSSILNAISQHFAFETGEISRKTGRGKHTTRAVELCSLRGERDSFVMDTPGFSMLDLGEMEPAELRLHYPEMEERRLHCRFDDCLHENEPDCAVKAAAEKGEIPLGRYRRYLLLLGDLKEQAARRYR